VSQISVVSVNPFQLRIRTAAAVSPEIQMISAPERLVIDLPNTVPGPGLHGVSVNHGDVKGVRTGLFSRSPSTTRIVVDLNGPQTYRVAPDPSGLLVSLGPDQSEASTGQPAIGWVSAKLTSNSSAIQSAPVVRKTAMTPSTSPAPRLSVEFANGLLHIHAMDATLSEVLFQIQRATGAEMAIPAGTEQERVAADFGPGTPSQVLAELLNGSGLNFVVVGSPADPNVLRSVLLSRATGSADAPQSFAQPSVPAVAEEIDPDNQTPQAVPPQGAAHAQQLPGIDPSPDSPPDQNQ
jgi:hypothetical protein